MNTSASKPESQAPEQLTKLARHKTTLDENLQKRGELSEQRNKTCEMIEADTARLNAHLANPTAMVDQQLRAEILDCRQTQELGPLRLEYIDQALAGLVHEGASLIIPFRDEAIAHLNLLLAQLFAKLKAHFGLLILEEDLDNVVRAARQQLRPVRDIHDLGKELTLESAPEGMIGLWQRILDLSGIVERFGAKTQPKTPES